MDYSLLLNVITSVLSPLLAQKTDGLCIYIKAVTLPWKTRWLVFALFIQEQGAIGGKPWFDVHLTDTRPFCGQRVRKKKKKKKRDIITYSEKHKKYM